LGGGGLGSGGLGGVSGPNTGLKGGGTGPQGAGGGTGQPVTGISGIIGVASNSKQPSLKVYNKREKYNEWEFVAILGQPGQPPPGTPPPPSGGTTPPPNPFLKKP